MQRPTAPQPVPFPSAGRWPGSDGTGPTKPISRRSPPVHLGDTLIPIVPPFPGPSGHETPAPDRSSSTGCPPTRNPAVRGPGGLPSDGRQRRLERRRVLEIRGGLPPYDDRPAVTRLACDKIGRSGWGRREGHCVNPGRQVAGELGCTDCWELVEEPGESHHGAGIGNHSTGRRRVQRRGEAGNPGDRNCPVGGGHVLASRALRGEGHDNIDAQERAGTRGQSGVDDHGRLGRSRRLHPDHNVLGCWRPPPDSTMSPGAWDFAYDRSSAAVSGTVQSR